MSAKHGHILRVIFAPLALQELDVIWDWNEQNYGRDHATRYIDFLQRHIGALSENHLRGRAVEARHELRYIIIRRKAQGHGHVVVYQFDDKEVKVLHVFHTAQDWQTIIAEEKSSQ